MISPPEVKGCATVRITSALAPVDSHVLSIRVSRLNARSASIGVAEESNHRAGANAGLGVATRSVVLAAVSARLRVFDDRARSSATRAAAREFDTPSARAVRHKAETAHQM
jgi:hypothetical protein